MLSFVSSCGFGTLLEGNSKAPIETSEFNTNPNNSLPETQTGIFDLFDREQQLECCNYKNLQPMWAKDNLEKGDRV